MGHEIGDVGAVGAVHRDAAAAGDEADDVVAGHGVAAVGEVHEQIGVALDHNAAVDVALLAL